jgi:hypothetical protein
MRGTGGEYAATAAAATGRGLNAAFVLARRPQKNGPQARPVGDALPMDQRLL